MRHGARGGIVAAAPSTVSATERGARARLVLIVEDDAPTAALLASAVNEEHGYEASAVGDADEALDALARRAPDLLVIDIRLPGMSGLELYDRIRADPRLAHVPVVFETGTAREHAAELRERGIATYVNKPFDVEELVRFVKRLVPPLNGPRARRAG